jgi:Tetratricopeptide repeat
MNNFAITYSDLGQTKDAVALLEKVLEARHRILGDEHLDTLARMNNLAAMYRDLGQMKDAVSLQEKVQEPLQRILGMNILIHEQPRMDLIGSRTDERCDGSAKEGTSEDIGA